MGGGELVNLRTTELQLVQALWDGLSQKEVADRLGLRPTQVYERLKVLKRRVGVLSTIGLIRRCVQEGVLIP